eukprot:1157151-Pelagomonas_calceolata.AAC.3
MPVALIPCPLLLGLALISHQGDPPPAVLYPISGVCPVAGAPHGAEAIAADHEGAGGGREGCTRGMAR